MLRSLSIAALASVALTALPTSPRASTPASTPHSALRAQEGGEAEETELARRMEVVEEGMKFLRRGLRDPEARDECLARIVSMEEAALACKGLVPAMAAQVPEAEREAFVRAYRRDMAELLIGILRLEQAVLDGDVEAARARWRELSDLEDAGHERFTEDG